MYLKVSEHLRACSHLLLLRDGLCLALQLCTWL